jgi:hypothetical protein
VNGAKGLCEILAAVTLDDEDLEKPRSFMRKVVIHVCVTV